MILRIKLIKTRKIINTPWGPYNGMERQAPGMKWTSTLLPIDQLEKINEIANRKRTTRSAIIRHCLDLGIERLEDADKVL